MRLLGWGVEGRDHKMIAYEGIDGRLLIVFNTRACARDYCRLARSTNGEFLHPFKITRN